MIAREALGLLAAQDIDLHAGKVHRTNRAHRPTTNNQNFGFPHAYPLLSRISSCEPQGCGPGLRDASFGKYDVREMNNLACMSRPKHDKMSFIPER